MNKLITTLMSSNAGYGITLLRIVTGLTFAAHVAQWMESIGITPGYLMAALAGSAEFFGGLALVVGLLVRPAAVSLLVSMVVAAVTVHWANGFFITNNGFEYAMILGLISAVLVIEGAGKLSLDRAIAR